jgi:predicted HTH transcriptional regulator
MRKSAPLNPMNAQAELFSTPSRTVAAQPSARPLNDDQREVIRLLKERGTITTAEATAIFGRRIYHNAGKHIGTRLARMVKRGLIVRTKPGVFALPETL